MSSLIEYRANALGTYGATPAQRKQAVNDITSMLRARLIGANRASPKSAVATKSASETPTATGAAPSRSAGSNDMDRDMFLQLLVTQMQHQDPMSPMDNSQMLAQLAQFSSLEQLNNLNDTFNNRFEVLNARMNQLNFVAAQNLIGQQVHGVDIEGQEVFGQVDSVVFDLGEVMLRVGDAHVPVVNILRFGVTPAPEVSDFSEVSESIDAPDVEEVGT